MRGPAGSGGFNPTDSLEVTYFLIKEFSQELHALQDSDIFSLCTKDRIILEKKCGLALESLLLEL